MHQEVHDQVRAFVETWLPETGALRILDVGSYDVNGTVRALFERPGWTYVGADMSEGPNVDIVLPSEHEWSNMESASFDALVTVSTLEHTRHPWLVVREMARLLKPGGLACLTAPYAWPYHAHPIDCWRIYPDAMRSMMVDAGFQVLSVRMCSDGTWKGDTVGIGRRLG